MVDPSRRLVWIGRSEKDFSGFARDVRDILLEALEDARRGAKEVRGAKPLSHGLLKGLGIIELVEDFGGDTYRAVYTTKVGSVLAVLHVFKKKSKTGIATPQHEIELIRSRYLTAIREYSDE